VSVIVLQLSASRSMTVSPETCASASRRLPGPLSAQF